MTSNWVARSLTAATSQTASPAKADAAPILKSGARASVPMWIAFVACLLYGVALTLNSQVPTEGVWYLLDSLVLRGVKLYRDLHSPFQPFQLLESSGWRAILGGSWIASQVLFLVHLFLLTWGYFVLANRTALQAWQKTILFIGAFFVGTGFSGYHFGDYRVITDIAALYSLILLGRDEMPTGLIDRGSLIIAVGLLSGISLMTRINDGLMLCLMTGAILYYRLSGTRVFGLVLFVTTIIATSITLISLTGDSIQNYYKFSIAGATAIKGGSAQIMFGPLALIANLGRTLISLPSLVSLSLFALMGTGTLMLLRVQEGKPIRPSLPKWVLVTLLLELTIGTIYLTRFIPSIFVFSGTPLFMVTIYVAAAYAGFALLIPPSPFRNRLILVLIPFGHLVSLSMGSSGEYRDNYQPVGMFMVLWPYIWPSLMTLTWMRCYILPPYIIMAMSGLVGKIQTPVSWWYYIASPMFDGREIIEHPVYGPMIIDRRMDKFFGKVCDLISAPRPSSLFATPYSYANYYCAVPPWHDHVLTFFDTSDREKVSRIPTELRQSPPAWVLYERQPKSLLKHEVVYNHGRPLPHRALDEFIAGQVGSGKWKVVLYKHMNDGDYWYLIRTGSNVQGVLVPDLMPPLREVGG